MVFGLFVFIFATLICLWDLRVLVPPPGIETSIGNRSAES